MIDAHIFLSYIDYLFHDIPSVLCGVLVVILCIGTIFIIKWKGVKNGIRFVALLIVVEYIYMVFCSTVFFRVTKQMRKYDFNPFWSYNDPKYFVENIMNVLAFIPIGLLMGAGFKGLKWWCAMLIGVCLSVSIESLQFVFKKGFSEVDDVMHNTLGCLLGYVAYCLIIWFVRKTLTVKFFG